MMQPASAPFSRRMRVSLRVSMFAIATTLPRCRKLSSDSDARQFEYTGGTSRTIKPAAYTAPASRSSGFVPVLPMCG